jgi:hypothetical protein
MAQPQKIFKFMKLQVFIIAIIGISLSSCIGDDIVFDTVDESIRVTNPIDSLQIDSTHEFKALFLNNIGIEAETDLDWQSSDPNVLSIDANGVATGLQEGRATVSVEVALEDKAPIRDEKLVVVTAAEVVNTEVETTEREGTIRTTSSYVLEGSFILKRENGELLLEIAEDYRASSSLPGLYLYLTNNPNTTNGALEIGMVNTFQGAHTYQLDSDIDINQFDYLLYYCKPFGVKVGDGEIGE